MWENCHDYDPEIEKQLGLDRPKFEVDGIPRRSRIDLLTPAEKAIYDAVQAVENLPADVRLTAAVCLLQKAREKVAEYVESAPWCDCGTPDPRRKAKLDSQIEKWIHLTGTDENGDRFHHLGCGNGSPCPADGYLGDDWLIASLRDALLSKEDAITEAGIFLSAGDIPSAMRRLEKVMGPEVLKRQGI